MCAPNWVLTGKAAPYSHVNANGIDPDMRDEDIVRELQRTQRVSAPGLVILAGFACILVSIGWRILRAIF